MYRLAAARSFVRRAARPRLKPAFFSSCSEWDPNNPLKGLEHFETSEAYDAAREKSLKDQDPDFWELNQKYEAELKKIRKDLERAMDGADAIREDQQKSYYSNPSRGKYKPLWKLDCGGMFYDSGQIMDPGIYYERIKDRPNVDSIRREYFEGSEVVDEKEKLKNMIKESSRNPSVYLPQPINPHRENPMHDERYRLEDREQNPDKYADEEEGKEKYANPLAGKDLSALFSKSSSSSSESDDAIPEEPLSAELLPEKEAEIVKGSVVNVIVDAGQQHDAMVTAFNDDGTVSVVYAEDGSTGTVALEKVKLAKEDENNDWMSWEQSEWEEEQQNEEDVQQTKTKKLSLQRRRLLALLPYFRVHAGRISKGIEIVTNAFKCQEKGPVTAIRVKRLEVGGEFMKREFDFVEDMIKDQPEIFQKDFVEQMQGHGYDLFTKAKKLRKKCETEEGQAGLKQIMDSGQMLAQVCQDGKWEEIKRMEGKASSLLDEIKQVQLKAYQVIKKEYEENGTKNFQPTPEDEKILADANARLDPLWETVELAASKFKSAWRSHIEGNLHIFNEYIPDMIQKRTGSPHVEENPNEYTAVSTYIDVSQKYATETSAKKALEEMEDYYKQEVDRNFSDAQVEDAIRALDFAVDEGVDADMVRKELRASTEGLKGSSDNVSGEDEVSGEDADAVIASDQDQDDDPEGFISMAEFMNQRRDPDDRGIDFQDERLTHIEKALKRRRLCIPHMKKFPSLGLLSLHMQRMTAIDDFYRQQKKDAANELRYGHFEIDELDLEIQVEDPEDKKWMTGYMEYLKGEMRNHKHFAAGEKRKMLLIAKKTLEESFTSAKVDAFWDKMEMSRKQQGLD